MTTEERVLKTNYGNNYDAMTMSSGNLKIRSSYYTPQRAKTGKVRGEDPYQDNNYHRQNLEQKRIHWTEILARKEKLIANRHKTMKDQLAKQTKLEKEKAKKAKDQLEIYNHKIMKKNEKYNAINQR